MPKNEKSRKNRIDRLRMVLDDDFGANVHPDDEKYLKALKKRLGDSSKHVVYTNKSYKEESEEQIDSLKPKVTIHLKDEDIVEFPEITMEEPDKELVEEPSHKDEELYELEKVEVDSPEFIEVIPKEVTKKEATVEEKIEEIKQPEPVEEDLPEWEPVPAEKEEQIEPEKEFLPVPVEKKEEGISDWEPIKIEEVTKRKKVRDTKRFCIECGAKLGEGYEFCHKCSTRVVSISKVDEKKETKIDDVPTTPSPVELKTTSGWEPVDEKFKEETVEKTDIEHLDESIKEGVFSVEDETKALDAFNGIKSIDQETAKLLYENGITSIDMLKEKPIKELTKIKGIKRKLAKKIKKELKEYRTGYEPVYESFERGENPYVNENEGEEWDSYYEEEIPVKKIEEVVGYKHDDYILYEKEVETGSGKKRTVRFFSKEKPDNCDPIELPKGYEVNKNKKTGVPYLRKKK